MNKKMRARKRRQARRVALTLVLMLTVALVSIGGTIAWLTDKTDSVVNTFTVGDIDIDLFEHKYENGALTNDEIRNGGNTYKIVPGTDLPKDPTAVVKATSEACWLFVKIEESDNWPEVKTADGTARKVDYTVDSSVWTKLDGVAGVYYKKIDAVTTADTPYNILSNQKVVVSDELTKTEANAINGNLTLTFTAYAIQQDDTIATAAEAWAKIPTA